MHSHILQLIASTIWKIVNAIKIILPVIFHPESLEESCCDAASGVDLIASDRHWRHGFLHALVGVVDKTLIWPSDSAWMNLWLVVQTDRGLEIAGPMNFCPMYLCAVRNVFTDFRRGARNSSFLNHTGVKRLFQSF